MATTPSFTTGLLGYDPREQQLQQQKLWANMYAQAQSPYAQIGMGVGQLLGAGVGMLTGESTAQTREKTLLSIKEQADQQFVPGSPEYYKFVLDNLPAEAAYSQSKDVAAQEYLKAKKASQLEFASERKAVREDPESLDVFASKYATPLLAKAQSKGFNPETDATPETTEEIKAFAKLYALDKEPDYNKLMGLRVLADKEKNKEVQEEEKRLLTMESIRSTITKNKREVDKLEKEGKFDAGARWNAEIDAAEALFKANNIDPTKRLPTRELANTELVNAQKIALRPRFTGKAAQTTSPSDTGSKTAKQGGDLGQQVTAAFGSYEPTKYDYRIVNGQVQRKAK